MLVTLKAALQAILLPPTAPVLLALVGAVLAARSRGVRLRRIGAALLAVGVLTQWLLALPLVANRLDAAAQRYPALDLSLPLPAEAIVILGGGRVRHGATEYEGEPAVGGEALERVAYGAFLAHRTGLPVLVTGQPAETRAMRATLARVFGVETRWVEDRSRDTFENAQFSARILTAAGVHGVVLVTSAAHEWRAAQEFTATGLLVVPAPSGAGVPYGHDFHRYLPDAAAFADSCAAVHELVGDLARRAFAAVGLRRQGD